MDLTLIAQDDILNSAFQPFARLKPGIRRGGPICPPEDSYYWEHYIFYISAPFETGCALLRDAEMGRIPEERSVSKGAASRDGVNYIVLTLVKRKDGRTRGCAPTPVSVI